MQKLKEILKISEGPCFGAGSYRYVLLTAVVFLCMAKWLSPALVEVNEAGVSQPNVKWILFIFAIFVFLFLEAYFPRLMQSSSKKNLLQKLPTGLLHQFAILLISVIATMEYLLFTDEKIGEALTGHEAIYLLRIFVLQIIVSELIFLLVNSLWITSDIVVISSLVLAGVNYYVEAFKGVPVYPWDIYSLKTATSVSGNYSVIPTKGVVLGILLIFLCHQTVLLFQLQKPKRKLLSETGRGLIAMAGILLYIFAIPSVQIYFWNPVGVYEEYGTLPAFLAYTKYMNYQKPKGYTTEKAEELLADAKEVEGVSKIQAKNVIVIMDESFADLRVIRSNLAWDYTPFLDSLDEDDNVVRGNLYVPTFSGGTCNTEYEALTETSILYNQGNPFMTFFNNKSHVNSILNAFDSAGYVLNAFHPYLKTNWNRDKVYDCLGFDNFFGEEDMPEEDRQALYWGISDQADFRYIIDQYENKTTDNFFLFNVTMQNHGGYDRTDTDLQKTVDLSAVGDLPQAETYFTLLKATDSALEELTDYFSQVDEPTLIVFFGDHQVNLDEDFYDLVYGTDADALPAEYRQLMDITPFVIWANYDLDYEYIDKMSSNYLGTQIMKAAGMDMTDYEKYLYSVYQDYPVVSLYGIIDKDGNYYESDSDINDSGELLDLQYAQYYHLMEEQEN